MALPASRNVEEAGSTSMAAGQDAAAYERELEKRVKEILRGVSGVGEVDVMIVLKSSAEKVIQVDNSTSKSVTTEKGSGTERVRGSMDQEHSTVLTGSGSRAGACGGKRGLSGDCRDRHQCLRRRPALRAGRDFRGHGGIIRASGE